MFLTPYIVMGTAIVQHDKEARQMSEQTQASMAKTLATVHKVISRGVEVTRSRSQSFAEQGLPDEALWSGFISYARTFVNLTHAHHDGEEVLIFPFGQQKMPDTSFDSLIADHRKIAALLDEMGAAIDEAETNPATESASRISRLAAQIGEIWQPHIREEETIFSAARVNAVVTPEEQGKLMQQAAQHGMSHAGPDYLAAPFVLHNLEPEDRAYMAGEMPPIISQELVPVVWKDQWAPMKPFLLP